MLKELSKDQMDLIIGGVPADEYCATMKELILNNPGSFMEGTVCEGAASQVNQYCDWTLSCE